MTKTITLTGEETAVKLGRAYPYIWVRNLGDSDVYMSLEPNIVPDADGVITVPAGGGASTGDVGQTDTVYFLGDGKIEVSPQFNAVCPFFKPAKGGEITYQYMPVMTGITAFFEPSGIDIANGVWHNSVGENDIILNGGAVENGALKFAAGEYGELSETTEPDVYYIVVKKPDDGSQECVFGKGLTSGYSGYGREIFNYSNQNYYEFSKNGSPYIDASSNKTEYSVLVILNAIDVDTAGNDAIRFFSNGELAGHVANCYKGYYNGNIYLNKSYRGGDLYVSTTDTYIRAVALGTSQSTYAVIKNSEYLMKKFI